MHRRSSPSSAAVDRIASRIGIADSAPSRPKRFCADVLRGEELLERLGRVQPLEDVALLVVAELGPHALDLRLDPALLVGVLDVHVLDADRAAVGVAQHAEDVAERHAARVPPTPPVRNSRSRSQIVRP